MPYEYFVLTDPEGCVCVSAGGGHPAAGPGANGIRGLCCAAHSGQRRRLLRDPDGRDLLWAVKNLCIRDMRDLENHGIMEISHRRNNQPVSVDAKVEDVLTKAVDQNFVPVVDDRNTFIGIITRRSAMQYCLNQVLAEKEAG